MMTFAWIAGGAGVVALVLAFCLFAADEDSAIGWAGIGFVLVCLGGGLAIVSHESTPKSTVAVYCTDGAAVVVNESYCEKESNPGAFWLWIGPEPVVPFAERTKVPAEGALVDCTNYEVWQMLGLDTDEYDLPANGSLVRGETDKLREIGAIK